MKGQRKYEYRRCPHADSSLHQFSSILGVSSEILPRRCLCNSRPIVKSRCTIRQCIALANSRKSGVFERDKPFPGVMMAWY